MDAGGTYSRTIDGGDNWSAPTIPPTITATNIAGGGLSFVVASGSTLEYSSNGGLTFGPVGSGVPFIVALLAGSMDNYVATSGSLWSYSTDGGNNWTLASGSVPAFTPNFLAGCGGLSFVAGDNGGNWAYSTDGGDNWLSPTAPPTILQ